MPRPFRELVWQARSELNLDNQRLADLVGSSLRTVERYNEKQGGLNDRSHNESLIHAIHPKNPELAFELAEACGTRLEALGLVPPKRTEPAPPPTPPRPAARPEHADSVVCAAADALNISPAAVRPAVAAAFAKANALGMSVEDLLQLLQPSARP